MKFTPLAVRCCLLLSAVTSAAAAESVPWDSLASRLSSKDILTPGNVEAFFNECYGIFHDDPVFFRVDSNNGVKEGSNWQLLEKPSGLCMVTLSCAFDHCTLPASFVDAALNNPGIIAPQNVSAFALANLAEDEFNIPLYVVQPRSVADVVEAIKFSGEHGIPITVKTSGHHYSGASMRRGTLLVNMRTNFPPYSIEETADDGSDASSRIHECDAPPAEDDASYLGNACRLALARDKTAVVRVGGGEVWDQVLRSVLAYNDDPANADGNKYHVLSGAAGTVSAAGGWMASGGNSASRGTRTWGYGVDQVLQMEMVLPSGEHVRFGPAAWEADAEYLYPKTTAVKGFCNANPVVDETKWVWTECDAAVNFADLWMAARGGGGGTWGIVTSLVYQLHARPEGGTVHTKFVPLPELGVDPSDFSAIWEPILKDESMTKVLDEAVEDFKIDFYHTPSVLGVSEEDSNACGCDWVTYPHFEMPLPLNWEPESHCMGKKAAEAWAAAWNYYVTKGKGQAMLLGANFTESQIVELGGWAVSDSWVERFAHTNVTQAVMNGLTHDDLTRSNTANEDDVGFRPGHARDYPRPYVEKEEQNTAGLTTFNIPANLVLENRDFFVGWFAHLNKVGGAMYVLGGALSKSHDQMTSIPQNRRDSGIYVHWGGGLLEFSLKLLFGDATKSEGIFPGFVAHNHHVNYGPLKDDWTKPCPLSSTEEDEKGLCISKQEAVWGTALLERLEKIKAEVDPDHLMTCETGVGFGKELDDDLRPTSQPSSASFSPTATPSTASVPPTATPSTASSPASLVATGVVLLVASSTFVMV